MITFDVFQKIYDELMVFVPKNATKVVFYFEYGTESYSFEFFYSDGSNYTKCFDIPNLDYEALMSSFDVVDGILSETRDACDDKKWTTLTMSVDSEGNMHTDFDYSDLSSGTYEYKKIWKKKYLK